MGNGSHFPHVEVHTYVERLAFSDTLRTTIVLTIEGTIDSSRREIDELTVDVSVDKLCGI